MINQLYARLANDISTMRSLFTGNFTSINKLSLTLSTSAKGTANFSIFEDNVEKVTQRVTAGESVSWSPKLDSVVIFYINYYDENDLPSVEVSVS